MNTMNATQTALENTLYDTSCIFQALSQLASDLVHTRVPTDDTGYECPPETYIVVAEVDKRFQLESGYLLDLLQRSFDHGDILWDAYNNIIIKSV